MQLKLDELLCAVENARTGLVNLEALDDAEIARLQAEFQRISKRENGCAAHPDEARDAAE
jgi:low affinity Fe/Cu permease